MTLAAIVPAAGSSRRMGHDKRRIVWRDKTVLEHTVSALHGGGITSIVVVLEPASPCRLLAALTDCTLVENPQRDRGMLSSIRCGLQALLDSDVLTPGDPTLLGAAIQPGDHPFVPPAAVRALCTHFRGHQPRLLVPRYPRSCDGLIKNGHPLVIARSLFADAMACDDTVGLRQLLDRHAADVETLDLPYVDADLDLDTPSDLRRLLAAC